MGATKNKEHARERLGETRRMNCGLNATITAYRSSIDIDIRFENGVTRNNTSYSNFKNGTISYCGKQYKTLRHIGETRTMNCGLKATITAVYPDKHTVDLEFENGQVRKNVSLGAFYTGGLLDKSLETISAEHIGETTTLKSGHTATLIKWNNNRDITVQLDDGTVLEHVRYEYFKKGGTLKRGGPFKRKEASIAYIKTLKEGK